MWTQAGAQNGVLQATCSLLLFTLKGEEPEKQLHYNTMPQASNRGVNKDLAWVDNKEFHLKETEEGAWSRMFPGDYTGGQDGWWKTLWSEETACAMARIVREPGMFKDARHIRLGKMKGTNKGMGAQEMSSVQKGVGGC